MSEQTHNYWLVMDKEGGDEARFKARSSLPRWAVMKVAVAAKKGDENDQMVALLDLTNATLLPEEHERFDQYMSDHDEAIEGLQDALSGLFEDYTNRPLEQSSPSAPVLSTTQPTSRVVSFSRGTVEAVAAEKSSSTA